MRKFKVGQKVYVKNLDKYGTVHKVDSDDQPTEIEVDGQILEAVDLLVKALSIFKLLWLAIKGIFKKDE